MSQPKIFKVIIDGKYIQDVPMYKNALLKDIIAYATNITKRFGDNTSQYNVIGYMNMTNI